MQRIGKTLAIAHFLALAALIFWNYYSNTGVVNDQTVGEVSDKFANLFTPASYAFAIWGLIYLGLLLLAGYWIYLAFNKPEKMPLILSAAPTLILAHIGNALWLWFWLNEQSMNSVIIMIGILITLLITAIRLRGLQKDSSKLDKALIFTPTHLYFGWISVATIANFAAHLNSIDWKGGLSPVAWTIIVIITATLLGILMMIQLRMSVYSGVIIWALLAIAVRHRAEIETIMWTAIGGIICILIAYIGSKTWRTSKA
ncbi:MAG: tryptophan-rich sensory protein [Fluviicola sp.]